MIATDMAKSGRYSAAGIAKAIEQYSPHIESRKAGHVEDYARRTVEKAWNTPEVQQARNIHKEMKTQEKQRDRGIGFGR